MSARAALRRQDRSRLDIAGWALLGLALLIVLLSFAQSFYRMATELAFARGFDPDRPPHLHKVTETL